MTTTIRILLFINFVFVSSGVKAQTWDERPPATYDSEYNQEFNPIAGWDRFKFYRQWNTSLDRIFNISDISTGALQFQWIDKRIMCSKKKYAQPYVFENEIDYSTGSNRAGIVIRIDSHSESIQEPNQDPGFNREGIAFYPTTDGTSMIVQFSGQDKGPGGGTAFTRIQVPKLEGITNLKEKGTLRVEDFGTSIYVFYNDAPYIRIDLNGKTENIYTSGTVYNASMQSLGSFTGMEIEENGHVAIAQRDALLRLFSTSIKYNNMDIVFNPDDAVIFNSPYRDLYEDSWVATDALGRKMPDYTDIGTKSDKRRTVGIFYVTWHTQGHHTNFTNPYAADVTKILEADPTARLDANHPLWETNSFHWGEPEMGYFLSQDEYVIRKDMAMLANAGVDVLIMDVTNAVRYWDEWEVLFKTMQKIKAEGNKVPKFCFWAFNGPVISVVQDLYDGFYKTERYKDLWFYWNDKPLLLYNDKPNVDATGGSYENRNPNYDPDAVTNPDNPRYGDPYYTEEFYSDYTQEVKDFFSKRNMWWGYYEWAGQRFVGTENNWSFGYDLSNSQVKAMNPDDLIATYNGIKEQAAVTPAQHPSSLVGKSWSRASGEPELNEYDMPEATYVSWLDDTVENPENYGIYFQERWDEAISSDPDFIYINDWNEWTAGKYHDGAVNPFMRRNSDYYFVDQYNAEFNRGIQPMKDGYNDNYYMQMVQNIRKYKGVRRHGIAKGVSNISIDNDFSDWEQVAYEFRDAIGDTRHRSHKGYGGLYYTNETGRNDIMSSKVAYDLDNLYFYVKTVRSLSPSDDPNWMLLFVDADRNKDTGWEGYDYVINNGVITADQTILKKWTGSAWGDEVVVTYAHSGDEMEIGLPRSVMNMTDDTPGFYFKWVDNPQHLDDISAFFTDGEAAPDRRFNYNYKVVDSNDLDGDGVFNDIDLCPNTPAQTSVDANGCMLLDSNNFNIKVIGETCTDKNNGQIIIEAQDSNSYVANINGVDYDFTKHKNVYNLEPGDYEICIVITGKTSPYCYRVSIPEAVKVSGKSSSIRGKTSIEILEGTAPYEVSINGVTTLRTMSSTFDVHANYGDLIAVKTSISCEGIYSETIQLPNIIFLHPNPTEGLFELEIPLDLSKVNIEVYDNNSRLVSKDTYLIEHGRVQLDLIDKSAGIYFIKVLIDKGVVLKIIKE